MRHKERLAALARFGIKELGRCKKVEITGLPEHQLKGVQYGDILLLGNTKELFFECFERSCEAKDTLPNPMNRWCKRLIDRVFADHDGALVYPFAGPPYYPFQKWAMQAGIGKQSLLGPLIRADYGTWFAFRAAVIDRCESKTRMPEADALKEQKYEDAASSLSTICVECAHKRCLKACPANAFTQAGFDVSLCRSYLSIKRGNRCMISGCQARDACPVASDQGYTALQRRFHMNAFMPQS